MTTCQGCAEQLLEYVYGLLDTNDPSEAGRLNALRQHLETCADCQASYARAQGQKQLLGQASRVSTGLTFTAPKVEPQRSRVVFQRATHVAWYVAAACVLFALLTGSGVAYWWGKTTKWNEVELAQATLEKLRSPAGATQDQTRQLGLQLEAAHAEIVKLTKSVQLVQNEAEKQLAANTSYLQMLAPKSVAANNDTKIVVWNSTLTGVPAPVTEVRSNLLDSMSQKALSQQDRRNDASSYKLAFDLPSVAYSNAAGKDLVNEIVQDVSNKSALGKVVHALKVEPARYTAHLCTDKPIYQPGEHVYFRGLALEKTTLELPREELHYNFVLNGPDDKILKQWSKPAQLIDARTQQPIKDVRGQVMQGVGGESYLLPVNVPLGEYQLTLTEKNDRCDMQTVRFMVNTLNAPRYDKQLQFNRPSYTPGEEVIVSGRIKLPNQQPWVHGAIKGQIVIDGRQYDVQGKPANTDLQSSTDASGNVKLAFKLPEQVLAGQGTLSLQMVTSEGIDSWSHPLRIETGLLHVDCYPEGGDLIAGTPNTVYFQMRNKYGEAVEGEAELINSKKQFVQSLTTFHDDTESKASRGMGVFVFTPQANERYQIRMKKPQTSHVVFHLPAVKDSGVCLHIDKPVLPAGSMLPITITNVGKARQLAVSVHCRGVLIALDQVSLAATATHTIHVQPNQPLGGVYRVTVSEIVAQHGSAQLIPQAERLIYRHPEKSLKLNLKSEPVGGKSVRLQIDAKTEAQEPSSAYVTIVGVNKSLLQLAEATTTRRLPAHFLIAQEVKQPEDLEFADFFLSRHPSAPAALDLLLGVQGWRRFKETDDVAALEKELGRKLTDPLPIYFYDNRQETMKRVQELAKEVTEQSQEGKQLRQLKTRLAELQDQVKAGQQKQAEVQEVRKREIASAEQSYQKNLEQWQYFNMWFHIISAGVLGTVSLIGLGSILWRRAILPTHLVYTLGALSVLGLIGTAILWYWPESRTPQRQTTSVTGKQAETEQLASPLAMAPEAPGVKAERRSEEASVEKTSERQDAANQPDALAGATASRVSPATDKPEGADASGVPLRKQADGTSKLEKSGLASADKNGRFAQELNRDEKGVSNAKDAAKYYEMKKQPPPAKNLNLRGSNVLQQDPSNTYRSNVKPQVGQQAGYGVQQSKLVDNRAPVMKESVAQLSAKSKKSEDLAGASAESGKLKSPAPLGAGGFGGGGGMGGKGGHPGMPAPTGPDKGAASQFESDKQLESFNLARNALKTETAFFIREFSWQAEVRPQALSASPSVWSKTIFWHPMRVIPATGKLDIPIELPSADGAYHFEVFGHDGTGRLGTNSIEVKASTSPISLQIKLSNTEARLGDTVRLECQVENQSTRRQPRVIAKIQLPEGIQLSPSFKQMRTAIKSTQSNEDVEPSKWYLHNGELTLIWSELGSGQKVKLNLDLQCAKAGTFAASPSRAFLENQDNDATIVDGLKIRIR